MRCEDYSLDLTEKTVFLQTGIEQVDAEHVLYRSKGAQTRWRIEENSQTFEIGLDCFQSTHYWKHFELDCLLDQGMTIQTRRPKSDERGLVCEQIQLSFFDTASNRRDGLKKSFFQTSPGPLTLSLTALPDGELAFCFMQYDSPAPDLSQQSDSLDWSRVQKCKGWEFQWSRATGLVQKREFEQSVRELTQGQSKERHLLERSVFVGKSALTDNDVQFLEYGLQLLDEQPLSTAKFKQLLGR